MVFANGFVNGSSPSVTVRRRSSLVEHFEPAPGGSRLDAAGEIFLAIDGIGGSESRAPSGAIEEAGAANGTVEDSDGSWVEDELMLPPIGSVSLPGEHYDGRTGVSPLRLTRCRKTRARLTTKRPRNKQEMHAPGLFGAGFGFPEQYTDPEQHSEVEMCMSESCIYLCDSMSTCRCVSDSI